MSKITYKDRWIGKVERFNKEFLPGTPVVYTNKNGVRFITQVRYPAVILSNGQPIVFLKNLANYCLLDRVVALT